MPKKYHTFLSCLFCLPLLLENSTNNTNFLFCNLNSSKIISSIYLLLYTCYYYFIVIIDHHIWKTPKRLLYWIPSFYFWRSRDLEGKDNFCLGCLSTSRLRKELWYCISNSMLILIFFTRQLLCFLYNLSLQISYILLWSILGFSRETKPVGYIYIHIKDTL